MPTYRFSPPARLVVLVSGGGTNLQALLDAASEEEYAARVVAVGADREGIAGLERAEARGVPTFVVPVGAHPDRAAWDRALASAIGAHRPDVVLLDVHMPDGGGAEVLRQVRTALP